MATVPMGAAAGAAAGSIAPGIGTAIGAGVGAVASGVLGLFGANAQNTANSNSVDQAEAYNTMMADSVYQRTVADMKAAGINPMFLAMGAGTDGSPTSPTYSATNTLNAFTSSAEQIGDLYNKYQQGQDQAAKLTADQAVASVADQKAQAQLDSAQAQAIRDQTAASIATRTQDDAVQTADANTMDAKARAAIDSNNSKWNEAEHWIDNIHKGASTAIDALGSFGLGKYLFKQFQPPGYRVDPNTTGTFDLNTGEIHQP